MRVSKILAAAFLCAAATRALPVESRRWDPPSRYAGDYSGVFQVIQAEPEQVNSLCQGLMGHILNGQFQKYGCAHWNDHEIDLGPARQNIWIRVCIVVSMNQPVDGITPEALLDHELGHCNGWPASHPE